jgi:tripartite-type tricarboxylate transporter receptor subunit TctC
MQFIKKSLIALAIGSSAMLANAVEFTVHHAPGGPSDRVTRLIAKYLPSDYVVVNRPGAGGRIAVRHLLKDNTIMLATVSQIFVTNLLTTQGSGYEPVRDLEIVGTAAVMPNVLACRSSLAVKELKDLNGRQLNFGVAGYGSSEHIATEALFTKLTGNYQSVPYAQGGSTGVNDLLGGNLDCMFANYPTIKPFIEDRRITVLFSSHELGLNVSTWREQFAEQFPFQSYLSIIVSKQMLESDKRKIVSDIGRVFESSEFKTELKSLGVFVVARTDVQSTDQVERANNALYKFLVNSKIKLQ